MSLIGLLIVCVIVGGALYLLQLVPIDETVKAVICVVAIVVLIIYVLLFFAALFGLSAGMPALRIK